MTHRSLDRTFMALHVASSIALAIATHLIWASILHPPTLAMP